MALFEEREEARLGEHTIVVTTGSDVLRGRTAS